MRKILNIALFFVSSCSIASDEIQPSMVSTDSYLSVTSNILIGRVEKIRYVSDSKDQCSFVEYEIAALDQFRGDTVEAKVPVVLIGLSSPNIREGDTQLLFIEKIDDVKNDACLSKSKYFSNDVSLFRVVNRESGMFVFEDGYTKKNSGTIFSVKCSSDYGFLFDDFKYKGLLKLEAETIDLHGNNCAQAKGEFDSIVNLMPSFPEFINSDVDLEGIFNQSVEIE